LIAWCVDSHVQATAAVAAAFDAERAANYFSGGVWALTVCVLFEERTRPAQLNVSRTVEAMRCLWMSDGGYVDPTLPLAALPPPPVELVSSMAYAAGGVLGCFEIDSLRDPWRFIASLPPMLHSMDAVELNGITRMTSVSSLLRVPPPPPPSPPPPPHPPPPEAFNVLGVTEDDVTGWAEGTPLSATVLAALVGAVGLLMLLALTLLFCRRYCCGHRVGSGKPHQWNAYQNAHWSEKFAAMGVPYHEAWTQTVGSYTRCVHAVAMLCVHWAGVSLP
jgi:hypothetical protein